jgi:hypothetical protein
MYELIPLQQSHAANEIEAELKNLLITLFQKYLFKDGFDCNVMGIPFEGSYELITKHLINGNIANFDTKRIAEDDMRYLLLAWKYRNGKRGTHFLKSFIKCTWGNEFEIHQLWQDKQTEYPLNLKTTAEIEQLGLNLNDFYLTSRIRISLMQEEARDFPYDIAEMLKNTLPARLFISEIAKETYLQLGIGLLGDSTTYSIAQYDCEDLQTEEIAAGGASFISDGTAYSLAFYTADNSKQAVTESFKNGK